jgi:biopolymer transport protein ExbB
MDGKKSMMRKHVLALFAACVAWPGVASAWWNSDWQQRTQVTLNTTQQGVQTTQALSGVVVPVRLHSGNFDFLGAKPDGSDLRVVAADDKTPLKFWVERFDGANELAVIWVQLPSVMPASDQNQVYVYAGNEQAAAEVSSPALFDDQTTAAFMFAENNGPTADVTGQRRSAVAVNREANGMIGAALRLEGQQPVALDMGDQPVAPSTGPYSVAMWIKPATAGTVLRHGPLELALQGAQIVARLGDTTVAGGELPASAWAHVALTLGSGKATLYVNGAKAAEADVADAGQPFAGEVVLGSSYSGLLDQLELASTVRSAEHVRLMHAAQSADPKLVMAVTQTEDSAAASSEEPGHFGILIDNLTVDAWVVIVILALMFVVAAWVMYEKAVMVVRVDKDNTRFLEAFRNARDVMTVQAADVPHAPLARLYAAGLRELQKRDVGQPGAAPLSGASLDAVKAAVDADLIRESHTLNSKIVLLTIAISGGPFLGLLGTVVGVMITFAAIAAAGDVNVNAIAPGIAAALLATVAGLAVAIPALFGYNYLAARIKNISSDMAIFVDEFVTRVAETHGAR